MQIEKQETKEGGIEFSFPRVKHVRVDESRTRNEQKGIRAEKAILAQGKDKISTCEPGGKTRHSSLSLINLEKLYVTTQEEVAYDCVLQGEGGESRTYFPLPAASWQKRPFLA